jgi:hypothetical protein
LIAYEEAFERTETEWGPWTIVEATDRRYTWIKIYRTVIMSLEDRLGISHELFPEPIEVADMGMEETIEAARIEGEFIDNEGEPNLTGAE